MPERIASKSRNPGAFCGVVATPALAGAPLSIQERPVAEDVLEQQNRILELIASDESTSEVLAAIVRLVESHFPESLVSILLLEGNRLRHGAAGALPKGYQEAIDGVIIGPEVGSCGTAAYLSQTVITADIATDPKWQNWADLALRHGLRACWSVPVCGREGAVLGTFAVYSPEPSVPTPAGQEIISRCSRLVSIALERKAAETARRLNEKKLRQIQKMDVVGRLAGGIAHDFGNMVGVITGYSELLLRRGDLPAGARGSVEEIQKASERASRLIMQLMALSRRTPVVREALNLNDVVRAMESLLARLVGDRVEFVSELDDTLGLVNANWEQIEQVLLNLVINARDAMPEGGRIDVATRPGALPLRLAGEQDRLHPLAAAVSPASQDPAFVVLSVKDTGCGMSQEIQPHIWDPFYTTKGERGTGLGLATVYGIVQESNGFVEVLSRPDEGSEFLIYLPQQTESRTQ